MNISFNTSFVSNQAVEKLGGIDYLIKHLAIYLPFICFMAVGTICGVFGD